MRSKVTTDAHEPPLQAFRPTLNFFFFASNSSECWSHSKRVKWPMFLLSVECAFQIKSLVEDIQVAISHQVLFATLAHAESIYGCKVHLFPQTASLFGCRNSAFSSHRLYCACCCHLFLSFCREKLSFQTAGFVFCRWTQ